MLRVKYVSSITNNPVPGNTMYQVGTVTASPFDIGHATTTHNFAKTMTMPKSPVIVREDLGQSRASLGSRKSFNADDYLQGLKYKLKDRDVHNYSKNDFLAQEREYLKNSSEGMKKEYESQTHLNNFSMNIYEKPIERSTTPVTKSPMMIAQPIDKVKPKVNSILKGDDFDNFDEIDRGEEAKVMERKEDVYDF
jgi:hypothetical protein